MTLQRLLLRNLLYHWRGNLAVLLGVVVGTAVLTGALLVGDSLRGSLRDLTLRRLGWVDQAMVGGRFFRANLADKLPADRAAPAILLRATADKPAGGSVNRVTVLGVDPRFGLEPMPGSADGVVLGAVLARDLGAKVGDRVTLRVQKSADVPRESLLGQREGDIEALKLTVTAVLPEDDPAGRFSLDPSPEPPRNAFVTLAALQEMLDQEGRANALLIGKPKADLASTFRSRLDLGDWGLRLSTPKERADTLFARYDADGDGTLRLSEWYKGKAHGHPLARFATTYAWGILDPDHKNKNLPHRELTRSEFEELFQRRHDYLSLESRQLILEPAIARAALAAARETGLRAAPTLVYLCKLEAEGKEVAGIVAAVDPTLAPPLGPFLPAGRTSLADDEIVLVDWQEPPALPALKPGAKVTLIYKPPEHRPGKLPDHKAPFKFAGTLPLRGAADDPDLTPPFPGITDKDDPRQWKLPFEDRNDPAWLTDTIRQEYGDPLYWGEYRTTPKAYITLAAGQKLWASRFGDLTSIRFAPVSNRDAFARELRCRLDTEVGGFTFQPVKEDALRASTGGTDFAGLFLGFSFFLIAAALLLVSLLFRLNLDRRAAEVGLLLATGFRRSTVGWLLLGEGMVLAAVGAALGLAVALGYAALLLQLLAALWPGGVLQSFLRPHYADSGLSLVYGYVGSVLIAGLTIAWTLRGLGKVSPRNLLAGRTESEPTPHPQPLSPRAAGFIPAEKTAGINPAARRGRSWWVAGLSLVGAVVLLGLSGMVSDHEAKAGTFFTSGALLLTCFLALLSGWMAASGQKLIEGSGWGSIARLGVRNAARNRLRSLLTAGLLASAAFLIVAVESFRRQAGSQEQGINSPSGGFNLLGESELPLFDNPLQKKGLALPGAVEIVPLRLRPGDDASCLNLYQVLQPRLLGVSDRLIRRGGFQFASTLRPENDAEAKNPWLLLDRPGDQVPVFGEQNTVLWMLHKSLGGELTVTAGDSKERTLKISGLLKDSVFQSSLLLSEERFLKLFPEQQGYNVFLIRTEPDREAEVRRLLEQGLADRGLTVTPTAERLQAYLAVENTYLSTFQALGGLGLLLGSLGLAVVLLRGVWERRAELALLRALGYRRSVLGWMVLAENGFLLLAGLLAGTAAALLSVLPYVLAEGTTIPWRNLVLLLGLVPIVGLAAAALAVASTLRAPLVPALRRE